LNEPLLTLDGLRVAFATPAGPVTVVDGLGFTLNAGETLCIAGESGSGKSVTALSVMGLLPKPGGRVIGGTALFQGRDLFKLSEPEMQGIRGDDITMIFQEPMTSLNPVLSIGTQMIEGLRRHKGLSERDAQKRAIDVLESVRIPEARRRMKQYPHELSGGMRQRVMIAMAMSCDPKILIADEPTTALDCTIQAQILELMSELQKQTGTAIILITHDMGVVAEMADRVVVMRYGKMVEQGTVKAVFAAPQADYTKALLAAVPKFGNGRNAPGEKPKPEPILSVRDLIVRFEVKGGFFHRTRQRVHAVEKISFDLAPGETLALVGESGCGKSTTARAIMHLAPYTGSVKVAGKETANISGDALRALRRDVQMIFQDPHASLDPRMSVGQLVGEPLRIHGLSRGSALKERVADLFQRVGLTPEQMTRYPHEFSGGQRQRICIARALSLNPKIIIADDMAVVEQVSHRVAVMYLGQIVETGPTKDVLGNPQHPYTKKLLAAVPIPDPSRRGLARRRLEGEVPSPFRPVDYVPTFVDYRDLGGGHLVATA
jgi:peptide/nickel transport system ATP-binding protein